MGKSQPCVVGFEQNTMFMLKKTIHVFTKSFG